MSADSLEMVLERLRTEGGRLNAVVEVLDDRANAEVDRISKIDHDGGTYRALESVFYGVKDLIAVKGVVTGLGIRAPHKPAASADATVVRRLHDAGAVLTSTLTMTSLAGMAWPSPPGCSATGISRNPWDPRRWAGGSSGGPAAAVAGGLIQFALGSESGGSVIIPAAWCGVTGLRPTHGVIPTEGAEILSPTMDKVGVIARTANDCSTVFSCLVGADGRGWVEDVIKTVGIVPLKDHWSSDSAGTFQTAFDAFSATAETRLLKRAPGDALHVDAVNTLMTFESARTLRDVIEDSTVDFPDPEQRRKLLAAAASPVSVRDDALAMRDQAIEDWHAVFAQVDAVLTLASPNTAPIVGSDRPDDGTAGRILKSANLAGLPGIALPCGLSQSRLPLGLHLIGPRHSEMALLEIGSRFQSLNPFHLAEPPSRVETGS